MAGVLQAPKADNPKGCVSSQDTETTSFSYTPSDLDPPSSKIGLNHPQTAGLRKTIPFRTFRNLMASGGYHKNMRLHSIKLYGVIKDSRMV